MRKPPESLRNLTYWLDVIRWKARILWMMENDLLKNQSAIRKRLEELEVRPLQLFEAIVAWISTNEAKWDYELLQFLNRGYREDADLEEFIRPPQCDFEGGA